eukprot:454057-Hanusia_phi.AAC.5
MRRSSGAAWIGGGVPWVALAAGGKDAPLAIGGHTVGAEAASLYAVQQPTRIPPHCAGRAVRLALVEA